MRRIAGRYQWLRFKGAWSALFWSYMAILLLLIIIGSLLYWRANEVVEHSVEQTNSAMLGQLRELADGQFQMIDQLEQQIANHPKLYQMVNQPAQMTDQEQYDMIEVAEDLQRYKLLSPFIYDFYMYFPKSGTMLGPGVKTTPQFLFDKVSRFDGMNAQEWIKQFESGYHYRSFIPGMQVTGALGERNDIIAYMQTLPRVDRSKRMATLFIMINGEQLRKMLGTLAEAGKGEIYIVDSSNRMISSTAELKGGLPFRYADMGGDAGKLTSAMTGQDTVISFASSRVYDWKYVLEVPRGVFLKEVNKVRNWALLLFVLAAFSGAVVSVYLASRNSRPIRDLVSALTGGAPASRKHGPIEYETIRSSIQSARLTESELRARLSQQTPIIRLHFLNRLIKGYADPHELRPDSLEFMNVRFVSGDFAVMLVDTEEKNVLPGEQDDKEWMLVNFVLSNIATELANEKHIGFTTELDQGSIALLINFKEASEEGRSEELAAIRERLTQVLGERFRMKIAIGTSFAVHDIQSIGEAFRDALKQLDNARKRDAADNGGIKLAGQMPAYYYPLDIEQQLTNYVKSGEEDKTIQLLDALYADHVSGNEGDSPVGSYFLMHLSSTLFRIAQNTPKVEQDLTSRLLILYPNSFHHQHATFERLREDFRQVCQLWKTGRSDQGSRMLETVYRIIRERYSQNMLSVGFIADELGITQPYLSSFFKKATGQTIVEYIAKIRLLEAKRLLAETDLTVAHIAGAVGYSNDIGFIRFFKKYEGITPGQYRANVQTECQS
ncbi:AraC family transcriptional regulator [Paenibacillus sp. JDR-2]|uniref:AraC family transcriptional regulator n=1 Tax=Paenibacillus sp. (strain JDR-2) TaxID=324057 RepID=UPI0001667C37|nr:AraC family transcriptional regulator [Paenibacillus sp. JDR-2]ACT04458.1 transcriptional regulator, AraC family [Paenibacillus sp. JDR-2]